MRFSGSAVIIICIMVSIAHAEGLKDTANNNKVTLSGMFEVEVSEMVKARITYPAASYKSTVDHVWGNRLMGTIKFDARPASNLKARGCFEFREYSYKAIFTSAYNLGDFIYTNFFIREGQGIFSLFNSESMSIDMAIGFMPYKYNPEVRGLGEFLFKSGTYPFYLYTDFDRPFARLAGLRASLNYENNAVGAKFDFLALTERETRPFWDISFAAIGDIMLFKIIDIGAGVDFAHAVSMDRSVTEPKDLSTVYYKYNADSSQVIDSGYYTFAGTKVMARGTIDPFGTIRHDDGSLLKAIAGENGGKLYGEIAIIGLENHPANMNNPNGYDKLAEKMPYMIGLAIPAWKIFDALSLEFEYYPSRNPNSAASIIRDGYPLPWLTNLGGEYDTSNATGGSAYKPRWYWTLYMKKQIIKNFNIVCQIGRDHQRWEMPMNYQTFSYDYEDALVKKNEWGWRIKTIFNF
jgi:hypothetical protein